MVVMRADLSDHREEMWMEAVLKGDVKSASEKCAGGIGGDEVPRKPGLRNGHIQRNRDAVVAKKMLCQSYPESGRS